MAVMSRGHLSYLPRTTREPEREKSNLNCPGLPNYDRHGIVLFTLLLLPLLCSHNLAGATALAHSPESKAANLQRIVGTHGDPLVAAALAAEDLPPEDYPELNIVEREASPFDADASSDVVVLVGQTAFLTCRITLAGNWTVSWVRHRDIHLLTVGTDTYTADRRFRGLHLPHSTEWTLQIKAVTLEDDGVYECQLSTTPLRSHPIKLTVLEPETRILNGPEVFLHQGSTLNLTCIVTPANEGTIILWSKQGQVLNWLHSGNGHNGSDIDVSHIHIFDGRLWVDRGGGLDGVPLPSAMPLHRGRSARNSKPNASAGHRPSKKLHLLAALGATSKSSSKQQQQQSLPIVPPALMLASDLSEMWTRSGVSHLIVWKSQQTHSGRYTCHPLGSEGQVVTVHVLAEERPAAMQRGTAPHLHHKDILLCVVLWLTWRLVRYDT